MAYDHKSEPENKDPDQEKKVEEKPADLENNMDYKFLDGMRGIGAFVVYLTHYIAEFFPVALNSK